MCPDRLPSRYCRRIILSRLCHRASASDGSRPLRLRCATAFSICRRSPRGSLGRRLAAAGVGRHSHRVLSLEARLGGQYPCPHPSGFGGHWCYRTDTEISLRPTCPCGNLSTASLGSRFGRLSTLVFSGVG